MKYKITLILFFLLQIFAIYGSKSIVSVEKKIKNDDLNFIKNFVRKKGVDASPGGISMLTGDRLIHYAAKYNSINILRFLLSNKAKVDTQNKMKLTPLHYAAKEGSLDAISILVEYHASLKARDDVGETPLFYAVKNNRIGAVSLLLQRGADVNALNTYKETPLKSAIEKRYRDVAILLISKGAKMGVEDTYGETPFLIATMNEDIYLMDFMYLYGVDINKKLIKRNGATPMHIAAKYGKVKSIDFLIHHGGIVNQKDGKGRTPMEYAWIFDKLKALDFLIMHSPEKQKSEYGWSGLFELIIGKKLVGRNDRSIKKVIVDANYNVNWRDHFGRNSLHFAVWYNNVEAGKALIELKINVNCRDKKGRTPLHYAAMQNNIKFAKLLINAGAKKEIKDKKGLTPYDISKNKDLMMLLKPKKENKSVAEKGKDVVVGEKDKKREKDKDKKEKNGNNNKDNKNIKGGK